MSALKPQSNTNLTRVLQTSIPPLVLPPADPLKRMGMTPEQKIALEEYHVLLASHMATQFSSVNDAFQAANKEIADLKSQLNKPAG